MVVEDTDLAHLAEASEIVQLVVADTFENVAEPRIEIVEQLVEEFAGAVQAHWEVVETYLLVVGIRLSFAVA